MQTEAVVFLPSRQLKGLSPEPPAHPEGDGFQGNRPREGLALWRPPPLFLVAQGTAE